MSELSDNRPAQATPGDLAECYRRDAKHWQTQWEAAHWERADIRAELQSERAKVKALREALEAEHAMTLRAQNTLANYLPPDGISRDEALNLLLYNFDGPEQRAALALYLAATSDPIEAPSDVHPTESGQ